MTEVRLTQTALSKLAPGEWVWDDQIGYRRNARGNGGTWYIKYRAPVPGTYLSGVAPAMRQVKERLASCRNRSQAEGVLMTRRGAIFDGSYRVKRKAPATTLAIFAERFFESKRHLRTVKKYRQQLRDHLIPHFRQKPLGAISPEDCLDYYNKRLDTHAAVSTVNGEMACLKSLFSEAIAAGLCDINPVRPIKLFNPNNVRDRLLSPEETARLFHAAEQQNDFVRPLFHVLYHTGMRLGEALALEWADIEFDNQRLMIRRSKSGEGRRVPLRQVLADELIAWKPTARGTRWIFPARYDASRPMQSIRKGWFRLCNQAGISGLRPHDLRHNFTSMLQASGVSDSIIMSITGHKTHVMLHRYSHSNDAMRLSALESLPLPNGKANLLKLTWPRRA
jgi:integrase